MAVKCKVCDKSMPTEKVLSSHMAKRHDESMTVTAPVQTETAQEEVKVETAPVAEPVADQTDPVEMVEVKTADGKSIKVPANVVEQAEEVKEEDRDPEELVQLFSADNRDFEVSVGVEVWKGKVISVPRRMENEVRRLLSEGGFYVKN